MSRRSSHLTPAAFLLFSTFGHISGSVGQEGHPMSGSWVGDWGTNNERHRVVVILDWTGSELTGVINPGQNGIPIQSATVNPSNWSLHFEAAGRTPTGNMTSYIVEGEIDDLGTYNRTLSGTWTVNGVVGDFSITRQ